MNELWHASTGKVLKNAYEKWAEENAQAIRASLAPYANERSDKYGRLTYAQLVSIVSSRINDYIDDAYKDSRWSNDEKAAIKQYLINERLAIIKYFKPYTDKAHMQRTASGQYDVKHSAFDGALYHSCDGIMYGVKFR